MTSKPDRPDKPDGRGSKRRSGDRHLGIRVQFWVPPGREVEGWKQAAKAQGMTLSMWLRRAANRAVVHDRLEREVSA